MELFYFKMTERWCINQLYLCEAFGAVMVSTASALMRKHAGCCEVNPKIQSARP